MMITLITLPVTLGAMALSAALAVPCDDEDGTLVYTTTGIDEPGQVLFIRAGADGAVVLETADETGQILTLQADTLRVFDSEGNPSGELFVQANGHVLLTSAPQERPRVRIGVSMETVPDVLAAHLDVSREDVFLVAEVVAGGPAHTAGLQKYDVVTHVDGEKPASSDRLRAVLADKSPGEPLHLRALRAGELRDFVIEVAVWEEEPAADVSYLQHYYQVEAPTDFAGKLDPALFASVRLAEPLAIDTTLMHRMESGVPILSNVPLIGELFTTRAGVDTAVPTLATQEFGGDPKAELLAEINAMRQKLDRLEALVGAMATDNDADDDQALWGHRFIEVSGPRRHRSAALRPTALTSLTGQSDVPFQRRGGSSVAAPEGAPTMPSDDVRPRVTLSSEQWEDATRRDQIRVMPDWLECDAGEIMDISLGGAMLKAKKRLKGNLAIRVWTENEGLVLQARVLWSNPICFRHHECGIQWCSLGEENHETLERLIFPYGIPDPSEISHTSMDPGLKLIDEDGAEVVPTPDEDEALSIDDPSLRELVDAWPHLPKVLRDAITGMVHGNTGFSESRRA